MTETIQQNEESIGALVRRLENNYISGSTHPSKYVTVSFSEDIARVYAYLESKHISGEFDSQGREKPFFNVVLASRNIWFRATDLDRKNIRFKATKSTEILTQFVATAILQDWMRRENFGQFLNNWGLNMAGFNETIVEFVEQGSRLIPSVLSWNRTICDSIDFKNNPKIKIIELTEAQLRKNKSYNKAIVDKLCNALRNRENLQRQQKDVNNAKYIKLYEIHGEFSQATYNTAKGLTVKTGDSDIYFQQMHVISYLENKDNEDSYEDYTLFSGKEEDPHLLTALLPEIDGSIALRGAVKCLFDTQWMANHTVKAMKDQLDLASKLIFQTADTTFVGQNALSAIENGQILVHAVNMPLTQIQNNSHDIVSLETFGQMWKSLGNEIVGISEAMLGKNPPSGTAWGQTRAILAESQSLFEIMTENKGLYIEQMLRTYVIPFIKKQLKTSKEIATTLESYGIDKIDTAYIKQQAVKMMMNKDIESVLNGKQPTQDFAGAMQEVQGQMGAMGAQRFLKPSDIPNKTWADIFNDFEWDIECDITGEDAPDKDDLETLTTVLQTISQNPRVLSDPNAKLIFNKILQIAGGISPLELMDSAPYQPAPSRRFTETLDYKDAPDDVKRQIEAQAGLQPSQTPTPSNTSSSTRRRGTVGALPIKK